VGRFSKDLVWSQPEREIGSPQFSHDGNFIVLVSRVHWPDGAEAESLPDAFFDKLERRKNKDPHFADPIVKLIDLKGNVVCEVGYGTNPSLSLDNRSIAFSHQKNPISGLRPLARTQLGNDIEVFDCDKKQATIIARPGVGYLDNPIFLPDKRSIAYTLNEAVNGAMGGAVAVGRVALTDMAISVSNSRSLGASVGCAK
jgi:hypothetical protein